MKLYKTFTLGFLSLALQGCAFDTPKPNDPQYAPVPPPSPEKNYQVTGSIYQQGSERRLFEDNQVRQVGDIITVRLVERTTSMKIAETREKKNDAMDLPNPTLLGTTPQFDTPGILPLASHKGNNLAANAQATRNFEGRGESRQSNDLVGSITVSVCNVLPNGNLMIRGEKWMNLNQGQEYIRLTGIIRPMDVDPVTNTIDSQKIADARISYGGTGSVNDTNAKGWLSKFFSSIYWIF